jgi:hypothetical protein
VIALVGVQGVPRAGDEFRIEGTLFSVALLYESPCWLIMVTAEWIFNERFIWTADSTFFRNGQI